MNKGRGGRKKLSLEEQEEVAQQLVKTQQEQQFNINSINVDIKCRTENQKKFINLIKDKEIVIGAGFSGCGKTFLSCSQALKLLKTNSKYRRIMLVKSVTDLPGEDIGYLKGDVKEKMSPYMASFKDNFVKLIGVHYANKLQEEGLIEVQALAFVRGRTIDNTIIIVDEAQNITFDNMKAILTRIGENSKMIIIGDTKQIDLKNKKDSCLLWLCDSFEKNEVFGTIKFQKEDQVRNPIINIIEEIFDKLEEK